MEEQNKLELLTPAQRELEEIAFVYLELVGPLSARRITDRIYTALEKLKAHPILQVENLHQFLNYFLCIYIPKYSSNL